MAFFFVSLIRPKTSSFDRHRLNSKSHDSLSIIILSLLAITSLTPPPSASASGRLAPSARERVRSLLADMATTAAAYEYGEDEYNHMYGAYTSAAPGPLPPDGDGGGQQHQQQQQGGGQQQYVVGEMLNLCDRPDPHPFNNSDLVWTEAPTTLIRMLRYSRKYNKFLVPGQAQKQTTTVEVAIYIESMSSFRSQSNDFEVDMYLALSWFDKRLTHNCVHPILITDVEHASLIWNPDLYFVNSKFSYMHVVTTPNFMMLIYPDGMIFKSMRIDVTLSCNMKLERFPMDEQECPIQIQSYAYVEQLVNLTWHMNELAGYPIGRNMKIKLNTMNITSTKATYCTEPYPMMRGWGNWSCLRGYLTLQRFMTYHIFQTYVPTAMLVMISWLSFWLDIRASPARISLTITTLLTLTTMGNSVRQDLPQVSYVKAIDIWLSACTAFVFCVLLEYTLVNYFIGRKTSGCQIHTRPQTVTRNGEKASNQQPLRPTQILITEFARACGACAAKWERYAKHVDRTSRFSFPMAFAGFVVIYWCLCAKFPYIFDSRSG